jgi:hypothetical protein
MKFMTWSALVLSLSLVSAAPIASGVDDRSARTVVSPATDRPTVPALKQEPQAPLRAATTPDPGRLVSSSMAFEFSGRLFGLTYKGIVSSTAIAITAQFMGLSYTFTLVGS